MLNQKVKLIVEKLINENWDKIKWDNGLVYNEVPGHTCEVAHLKATHNGRDSAAWFSVAVANGTLGEGQGLEILKAIAKLQITDENSDKYGCLRWYGEEVNVNDSNGAFFVLTPLIIARLVFDDKLSKRQIEIINEMLDKAVIWFSRECKNPILYYSNKILSDGALLILIAKLINNKKYFDEAVDFFKRWEAYTEKRGWGWGENLSLGYNGIILNTLRIASTALKDDEPELAIKLENRINNQLDYFRFSDGREPVPTIRSYNFDGETVRPSIVNNLAGIKGNGIDNLHVNVWDSITMIPMFAEELYMNDKEYASTGKSNRQPIPRVRKERIFDDSYSYSWLGENGGIGSINKFPVIPGSYQFPTWGLAWQSMPVSFITYDEQVSYLRWGCNDGERMRFHPSTSYKAAYLSPALFKEKHYPDIETNCCQNENVLVALRSMTDVLNNTSEIYDELLIHRFSGRVQTIDLELDDSYRQWIVLYNKKSTVLITPLLGIRWQDNKRKQGEIIVSKSDETLELKQILYSGKEVVLEKERLEANWLVIFKDNNMNEEEVQEYLRTVEISDTSYVDGEIPRSSFEEIHKIKVSENKKVLMNFVYDNGDGSLRDI